MLPEIIMWPIWEGYGAQLKGFLLPWMEAPQGDFAIVLMICRSRIAGNNSLRPFPGR